MLISARAVQGLGAAIISPAALSIVTTTFAEGAERNKALGIWGALGGSGAAAGVLFGGILTKYLGWEWIFWVNVPVGVLVFVLASTSFPRARPSLVTTASTPRARSRSPAGLALLVYAISKAPDVGWGIGQDDLLADRLGALLCASRRDRDAKPRAAGAVPDLPAAHAARRRTWSGSCSGR